MFECNLFDYSCERPLIMLMQLSRLVAFDHKLCKENEDIGGAAHSGGGQQHYF